MNPKVSIIILNWNNWEDTLECIESLNQISYPNYDIIIVDNGSNNNSIQKIKDYCNGNIKVESSFFNYDPTNKPIKIKEYLKEELNFIGADNNKWSDMASNRKITIIKNKMNYGFTKGNNIAINYAIQYLDPEYILLLNNDTVVDPYFLNILVDFGEKNRKTGFLGPKIYFYEFNGKKDIIQHAGTNQSLWLFHSRSKGSFEVDRGQYDEIKSVDFVQGSCILARVEMIKEIGFLDEVFFSYREENDWSLRGHENGWELVYIPKSKIWHKGGKSSGGIISTLSMFYMTRNDFLFIKKHGNFLQIILFYLYFIIFKFWFFSGVYLIYHRNFKIYHSFLRGAKEGVLWNGKK